MPRPPLNPCPRLCIDDLRHGCREDTLCGGTCCYQCDLLTSGDMLCEFSGSYTLGGV